MTESERKTAMKDCPILCDYLATALADLQYTEDDESCSDDREARDSGTVYDCPDETFLKALQDCQRFMSDCAAYLASDDLPNRYRQWDSGPINGKTIGSDLYLTRAGHGTGFWEYDAAPLDNWCERNRISGLYFGDNGQAYW